MFDGCKMGEKEAEKDVSVGLQYPGLATPRQMIK
jgi:hypothetical protein